MILIDHQKNLMVITFLNWSKSMDLNFQPKELIIEASVYRSKTGKWEYLGQINKKQKISNIKKILNKFLKLIKGAI
jgi:hypothetical protein